MNLKLARRWCGAAILTACGSAPTTVPKSEAPHAIAASTRNLHRAEMPAEVAMIRPRTGRSEHETVADAHGRVTGVQRDAGVTFLRIQPNAAELAAGVEFELALIACEPHLRCQAAMRDGVATPIANLRGQSTPTRVANGGSGKRSAARTQPERLRGPELLVRVSDAAAAAKLQAVTLRVPRRNHGGLVQRLVLEGFDTAPAEVNLERDFAASWANQVRRIGDGEPFAEFAAARIEQRRPGAERRADIRSKRAAPRSSLRDLMDFYTGRTEVERNLQTDRGLGTGLRALPRTIDISTIRGVESDPRDYRALAAAATGIQKYVPHRLADGLPDDVVVVEFPSIKQLVTLPQLLEQELGGILAALEGEPGTMSLFERYQTQLILERSGLAEKLGHLAVGAVSVAIGDPYLREGTDVSLVLEVRERKLLETALEDFVIRSRRMHPDLEVKNLVFADLPVTLHSTPDGRIRRYAAWSGGELVISNSRVAIERILDIRRNPNRSLSANPDYRWSRSLAPYDPDKERAFLFFGDAFVEKVTGPRSKILEARRTLAQSELRSVEFAALLYGWMQGKPPRSREELLASGWLTQADLRHFDGSPIAFDVETGAASRFGTADQLLPIIEFDVEKIDKAEAAAYAEFRERYERSLRGALDPTSLRILRGSTERQLSTELRILPLAPSGEIGSQFRSILRTVGLGTVQVGKSPNGLRAVLGISQDSAMRDLANMTARRALRNTERVFAFLGDWVEAGVEESPLLWNFAVADRLLPEFDGSSEDRAAFGLEQNIHRLPIWVSAQVKSPALLTAALAALRIESRESLGDWVTWHDGERFGEIGITRIEIRPNGSELSPVMLHLAVAKDVLILSLDRHVLESRIQQVLSGERPKAAEPATGASQLIWDYVPGSRNYFGQLLAAWLEEPALVAHHRACIGQLLLAAGIGEQAANSDQRLQVARRVLGYLPESPGGPGLVVRDGLCEHPVYGTTLAPVIPDGRDKLPPLHEAIRRLRALRFGLTVLPRATEQELVGRIDVEWD